MIKRIWTGHRALAIALPCVFLVAFLAAGLVLVGGAGGTSHASATPGTSPTDFPSASPSDSPTPIFSPTPTINTGPTPLPAGMAYSDLDGVATTTALAHRLPMAIMIDDQTIARPQSGMSSASIVYQAPADGAQDRYMLVFQEGTATAIGPVRSSRPYYVYWAAEYQALYGHYGGDWTAINRVIPAMANNIYNMDALRSNGTCPYHRITTRPKPHNAYTSSAALIGCSAARKLPATYQNLPTRPFKDDLPLAQRPAAQTITIAYRTGSVAYKYIPATDTYQRIVDWAPQIDPANGQQVYARNIIVMYQGLTYDAITDPPHVRPVLDQVGSGKAIVFQEGKQIAATWKKKTNTALTRFYDKSGKEIQLVRGEIFIQSIPSTYAVTVK
jgi:hypothetical protein